MSDVMGFMVIDSCHHFKEIDDFARRAARLVSEAHRPRLCRMADLSRLRFPPEFILLYLNLLTSPFN